MWLRVGSEEGRNGGGRGLMGWGWDYSNGELPPANESA